MKNNYPNFIFNETYTQQDFSITKLSVKEYDTCVFVNCDFTETDMSLVIFLECTFIDCNFTKVILKETCFRDDSVFEGCKMIGVYFDQCDTFLLSITFRNCILNYASFHGFKIKNTQFMECKLQDADFTNADISGVTFDQCDLNNAVFQNTIASKTDFRSAKNYKIDPTKNILKKAKFSHDGLIGLVDAFDIIVS
ncbi:pentapeptide repeat-containing protein [Aquimarina addita]|uniref:Pentapeptide repeat-containing protein n=1 Tax=Aquimarina addita TaxID=870485 RepID=A0ABP7XFE9_9FLAO